MRLSTLSLALLVASGGVAAAQSTGTSSGLSASPSGASSLTGAAGTPSGTGTTGSTAGANTPNATTHCANADPLDTTAQELGCPQTN